MPLIGSYDAENQVLTLLKTDIPEGANRLCEFSMGTPKISIPGRCDLMLTTTVRWKMADNWGPFYELEASSPALALERDSSATHIQSTYHFEGPEE
jgi:hypothetical protein